MKKLKSFVLLLYRKVHVTIVMRIIKWLYNYIKKRKNRGDENATKHYLSIRKMLFASKMMPIADIFKSTDSVKNKNIKAESTQYLNESAINRVTSGDTYDFLKKCDPQEARDIITHFFPKQIDFDVLVKNIETNDREGFEAEIVKRDNKDFYKYCGGASMVNEIQSNARNRTSKLLLSNSAKSKLTKDLNKIDVILGSDLSEMMKIATDFDDYNIEPLLPIYQLFLDVIIESDDDTWIDNKQRIYKILNDPFVKEIFDGCKYIEDKLNKSDDLDDLDKKQLSEKTPSTVLLEKLIVVEVNGCKDEEKSKIVVENIKKYYEHLIYNKQSIKGVPTGKLFLALRELHYLNQTDVSIFIESITEFGRREIDDNFNIGADNGVYKFINNIQNKQQEAIEEIKNKLKGEEKYNNES